MRALDVMSKSVATIESEAPAEAARARMRERRIRHLVVVEGRDVVGIVSSHDVGGTRAGAPLAGKRVADVMTPYAVTVTPDAPVRKIANVLRGRTLGCVPVMDGSKLVGIVTVTDLLELIGRGLERGFVKTERRILRRRAPRSKPLTGMGRTGRGGR